MVLASNNKEATLLIVFERLKEREGSVFSQGSVHEATVTACSSCLHSSFLL